MTDAREAGEVSWRTVRRGLHRPSESMTEMTSEPAGGQTCRILLRRAALMDQGLDAAAPAQRPRAGLAGVRVLLLGRPPGAYDGCRRLCLLKDERSHQQHSVCASPQQKLLAAPPPPHSDTHHLHRVTGRPERPDHPPAPWGYGDDFNEAAIAGVCRKLGRGVRCKPVHASAGLPSDRAL